MTRADIAKSRVASTRGCLATVLMVAAATCCHGGIAWERREATVRAGNTERTVVEFPFRNDGLAALRILTVTPSCGCVTAGADKSVYEPGAAGVIRAELAHGGKEGRLAQTIAVLTDVAPEEPVQLSLVVEVPQPITLRSRAVSWAVGEAPVAKEIEITVSDAAHVTLDAVQTAEPTFSAQLEPLARGGHFRIKVVPSGTGEVRQATIRLDATVAGVPRVLVLQALIK